MLSCLIKITQVIPLYFPIMPSPVKQKPIKKFKAGCISFLCTAGTSDRDDRAYHVTVAFSSFFPISVERKSCKETFQRGFQSLSSVAVFNNPSGGFDRLAAWLSTDDPIGQASCVCCSGPQPHSIATPKRHKLPTCKGFDWYHSSTHSL